MSQNNLFSKLISTLTLFFMVSSSFYGCSVPNVNMMNEYSSRDLASGDDYSAVNSVHTSAAKTLSDLLSKSENYNLFPSDVQVELKRLAPLLKSSNPEDYISGQAQLMKVANLMIEKTNSQSGIGKSIDDLLEDKLGHLSEEELTIMQTKIQREWDYKNNPEGVKLSIVRGIKDFAKSMYSSQRQKNESERFEQVLNGIAHELYTKHHKFAYEFSKRSTWFQSMISAMLGGQDFDLAVALTTGNAYDGDQEMRSAGYSALWYVWKQLQGTGNSRNPVEVFDRIQGKGGVNSGTNKIIYEAAKRSANSVKNLNFFQLMQTDQKLAQSFIVRTDYAFKFLQAVEIAAYAAAIYGSVGTASPGVAASAAASEAAKISFKQTLMNTLKRAVSTEGRRAIVKAIGQSTTIRTTSALMGGLMATNLYIDANSNPNFFRTDNYEGMMLGVFTILSFATAAGTMPTNVSRSIVQEGTVEAIEGTVGRQAARNIAKNPLIRKTAEIFEFIRLSKAARFAGQTAKNTFQVGQTIFSSGTLLGMFLVAPWIMWKGIPEISKNTGLSETYFKQSLITDLVMGAITLPLAAKASGFLLSRSQSNRMRFNDLQIDVAKNQYHVKAALDGSLEMLSQRAARETDRLNSRVRFNSSNEAHYSKIQAKMTSLVGAGKTSSIKNMREFSAARRLERDNTFRRATGTSKLMWAIAETMKNTNSMEPARITLLQKAAKDWWKLAESNYIHSMNILDHEISLMVARTEQLAKIAPGSAEYTTALGDVLRLVSEKKRMYSSTLGDTGLSIMLREMDEKPAYLSYFNEATGLTDKDVQIVAKAADDLFKVTGKRAHEVQGIDSEVAGIASTTRPRNDEPSTPVRNNGGDGITNPSRTSSGSKFATVADAERYLAQLDNSNVPGYTKQFIKNLEAELGLNGGDAKIQLANLLKEAESKYGLSLQDLQVRRVRAMLACQ